MIASDYFVFGIIVACISIFFAFSLRYFIMRLRNGSLRFKRSLEVPPMIFDIDGTKIEACSSLVLHKFRRGWCVWCGKSFSELNINQVGVPQFTNVFAFPQPDFNSPTTLTIKPADLELPVDSDLIPDPVTLNIGFASAFCLRCKLRVNVLDPVYYDQESRRGVRRYLKGTCSVCKSKINAIVKKSD